MSPLSKRIVVVTLVLVGIALLPFLAPSTATAATLPITQNGVSVQLQNSIACQRAIEEIYWQYREWPAENSTPKPALDAVLTPDQLRTRAEDGIRFAAALDTVWQQPLTAAMVQAEMDRIAAETREPDLLRDLWAALGNDSARIANCFVRPALAERLAREWYATDDRFHGTLEAQARTELAAVATPSDLSRLRGEYAEATWRLDDPRRADLSSSIQVVDTAEWNAQHEALARYFDTTADAIPTGKISTLQEDGNAFFALAVLSQSDTEMRVATVRWEKQSFDAWWATERTTIATTLTPLTGTYRLPAITGELGDPGTWLPTPSIPYNTGPAVWTGSEMILWGGGIFFGGRSDEGWRYNPATDTWTAISTLHGLEQRNGNTAIWTGEFMIIWGGCGPRQFRDCELSDGARYNPTTGLWTPVSDTNAPRARLRHTAVWTGSEMIIWGGCAPRTNADCSELNTGGRYDPATDTWIATSLTNVPEERYYHTAVWTGSEMIVWGGEDGLIYFNTGARYNPATDSWIPTSTTAAPTARGLHTAIWTGEEMIIWGGCSDTGGCTSQGAALNTGARYNPATDSWTPTSTTNAPSGRDEHTAIWTEDLMIVWGGVTSNNIEFNTGGRYDPATDTWTPTSTTNAPVARYGHTAVWTGSLMIVWGGQERSGGRYDPTTDSWTPTGTNDPGISITNQTAVWTGVEMIAWGGQTVGGGTSNRGRLYNPTTRIWRETSQTNAPVARYRHTAVWTGTEMLVWGRYTTGVDQGGRYNPTSNTWTPMSTTNSPPGRDYPTGVWTGNEFIVWGGDSYPDPLNTGGRYDPATDTWTPTSTTNAPDGRVLHTAVWTGDEMIVWGGIYGDSVELDTGGRYDPVTDTWAPTSTTNAPGSRHLQAAVWTGGLMIVWGGVADLDNPVNPITGGRYNPTTDTWTPTSTTNAPEGRARMVEVWTGNEMIVWGGCLELYCGDAVNTGGRYDPVADAWTPMPIEGDTPRPRGDLAAVWTGDRMILWGGYTDLSTYTHTGAEYFVDAPGNQPPVATADSYSVPENTTLTVGTPGILSNDSDPDDNGLTAALISTTLHGTLTLNGNGSFTYVPTTGFTGSDSFVYRAWDGLVYSNEAGVTIEVTGAGATPTNTATATLHPTITASPSATPSPFPGTLTPTPNGPTATNTPSPVPPTVIPTGTIPTATVTLTPSPVPPSVTPTGTIPTATNTPAAPPSVTPTGTIPTATNTPVTPPSVTPTGTIPTATNTPTGTITPASPTPAGTAQPSATPSVTGTPPPPDGDRLLYLPMVWAYE